MKTPAKRRFLPNSPTLLSSLAALLLAGVAFAVAPPANTSIGNQASATYTDASNTQRTATSNTVVTIVQQVASFTLTTDGQAKPAAPGGQAVYPHTLTNTGNGDDTFALSVTNNAGDNFDLTNLVLYADVNGDGIPDNSTPITSTGPIAAGDTFKFVASGIVASSQTALQTAAITVTAIGSATSTPAPAQNNIDTTTVTSDAVINVTKSVSAASGTAGSGPYTFTLTYTNTGNNTAAALTLTDVIPSGMTYVAGSARWSITGPAVTLTDANDGTQGSAPNTIAYDFGQTAPGRVTAVVTQVAPGESRSVSFQIRIAAAQPAGPIQNTANYSYDPGTGTPTPTTPTNTATFRVIQGAAVSITGSTVASAVQGSTVVFTNVVTNLGNGADSFDITLSNTSFPIGTTFQLFKTDGVTPLVDTNGNGTPDVGTLATNGTYALVVHAILPSGASGTNVNYTVNVIATSRVDSSVSSNANDVLTSVTSSTVDLTNTRSITGGANAGDGLGVGPEASPVVTNAASSGTQTRFVLFLNNTGTGADSYALTASSLADFSTGLPAGWTVVFTDVNGTVLTNTGAIPAGGSKQINADISIPTGSNPGPAPVYFRALSPTSGSIDRIHDQIDVAAMRRLSISPNNSGQVVAAGTVVFSHTIANTGNVLEGDAAGSSTALSLTQNQAGWTSVLYFDANNNGVIDPTENPITDLSFVSNGAAGLAPGESIRVLVKVTAPAGAPAGQNDSILVSATTTNGTYTSPVPPVASATDSAVVVASDLQILKEQALDANLDGTPDGPYTVANLTAGARPGAGLRYRITVRNNGTAPVDNVKVYDSTPAFTSYTATSPAAVAGGSAASVVTVPADAAAGSFQFDVGTLNPAEQAVVTFGVKIDQ